MFWEITLFLWFPAELSIDPLEVGVLRDGQLHIFIRPGALCGLWDLSSPIRGGIHVHDDGSFES